MKQYFCRLWHEPYSKNRQILFTKEKTCFVGRCRQDKCSVGALFLQSIWSTFSKQHFCKFTYYKKIQIQTQTVITKKLRKTTMNTKAAFIYRWNGHLKSIWHHKMSCFLSISIGSNYKHKLDIQKLRKTQIN